MATAEEANEFLGGLAAHVDDELTKASRGEYAFSLVFWKKGQPEAAGGFAIMTPPGQAQAEQRTALLRAASLTPDLRQEPVELHGLDTADRVCFYEQDFYVLSNFSAFAVDLDGVLFPTVEHAYHWHKFWGVSHDANLIANQIKGALSAHEAFKMAEASKQRRDPNWDRKKVHIMMDLLRAKAAQHEYVRRKLLATGKRELVENSWRDDFWGWGPNRDGKNVLGRLWMAVRAELRGEPVAEFIL